MFWSEIDSQKCLQLVEDDNGGEEEEEEAYEVDEE